MSPKGIEKHRAFARCTKDEETFTKKTSATLEIQTAVRIRLRGKVRTTPQLQLGLSELVGNDISLLTRF